MTDRRGKSAVLAIDFGTSFSSAAVALDDGSTGGPSVVAVKDPLTRSTSFPSAVCVDDAGELLVGQPAVDARGLDPQRYKEQFKRDVGADAAVQLGDASYGVRELVAAVLRHLHTTAARRVDVTLGHTVLTVPADFGPHQRTVMRQAAAAAGIDGVELLEEPVAGAFAPAVGLPAAAGDLVLVYDFGGGTFDAALVRVGGEADTWTAVGHSGLTDVGGNDIDELIYADVLVRGGPAARARVTVDPTADKRERDAVLRRRYGTLDMVRRLKHRLSAHDSAKDWCDALEDVYTLNRTRFDAMVAPLVAGTIECCQRLLARHDLDTGDIASVLLVGGVTRMPIVAETLQRQLGRPLRHAEDPELAVAVGAARQQLRAAHAAPALAPPTTDPTTTGPPARLTDGLTAEHIRLAARVIDRAAERDGQREIDVSRSPTPPPPPTLPADPAAGLSADMIRRAAGQPTGSPAGDAGQWGALRAALGHGDLDRADRLTKSIIRGEIGAVKIDSRAVALRLSDAAILRLYDAWRSAGHDLASRDFFITSNDLNSYKRLLSLQTFLEQRLEEALLARARTGGL